MVFKKYIISALAIFTVGLSFICWGTTISSEPGVERDISPYAGVEIIPLKPEECGQCHTRIYYLLKNDGGKHRIDCKQCHVQFHIYRPGKTPYKEVLPKCATCHEQPHGPELTQCTTCHQQVHTPLKIPAGRLLDQGCYICHPDEDREIKTYITQHTELYCSACHHTHHGYVPQCLECHQPHAEGVTSLAVCLTCHPPHKALEVVYPADIPPEACATCHRNAYQILKQSHTKHSAFRCTKCHPDKHKTIMRCQQCHGQPHGAALLGKFRVCGQCHGPAHSLVW